MVKGFSTWTLASRQSPSATSLQIPEASTYKARLHQQERFGLHQDNNPSICTLLNYIRASNTTYRCNLGWIPVWLSLPSVCPLAQPASICVGRLFQNWEYSYEFIPRLKRFFFILTMLTQRWWSPINISPQNFLQTLYRGWQGSEALKVSSLIILER